MKAENSEVSIWETEQTKPKLCMCAWRSFTLHGVCMRVSYTFHILHPAASSVISVHTLMRQFFRIEPISFSNLVNLAILHPPRGFQSLGIMLSRSMLLHWMGWEEEHRGCVWRLEGGGDRRKGGSYRTFDIIMVHYISDSSLCSRPSSTWGQTEYYHLAATEASVAGIII